MKLIEVIKNSRLKFPILMCALMFCDVAFANLDTLESKNIEQTKIGGSGMNNELLEQILRDNGTIIKGSLGFWQVQYLDRVLTVVTDAGHNRMRIMTAIMEKKDLKKAQTIELLQAQFDRALDVKYALYNDILWSAFVHPLKELTENQVKDALSQVYFAAYNFGGSYRSTDLQFGNREE